MEGELFGIVVIGAFLTQFTTQWHIMSIVRYGALDYTLALAKEMQNVAYHVNILANKRVSYAKNTADFAVMIQDEIDRQDTLRLVLAASLKDKDSSLYILGPDILRQISQHLRLPQIVLWENVLGEYLEAEDT